MDLLVAILIVVGAFFIFPFISFMGGWFLGWLIKITIGGSIVNGLALVGLQIPLESLPLFFGTLAVISSFFKMPNTNLGKSDH